MLPRGLPKVAHVPAFSTQVLQLVLEALTHLHAHKIYHLDIKPENILLDGAGRPHIADYDISQDGATRAIRMKTLATRMGTDGFIAPEIEAGRHADTAVLRGTQHASPASTRDATCFQAALPTQEEPSSHEACSKRLGYCHQASQTLILPLSARRRAGRRAPRPTSSRSGGRWRRWCLTTTCAGPSR